MKDRLLPSADIGFAKPAIEYELADGTRKIKLASKFDAPAPELARLPALKTVEIVLSADQAATDAGEGGPDGT